MLHEPPQNIKPTEILLHQKSHILEITFEDGAHFRFSCEYLRVYSPSAEVQGHGPGQETLQIDKEHINIRDIEPVGNYAVILHFDDGHNTGIYSWQTLYSLGIHQESLWRDYLERLAAAGHQRASATAH